MSGNAAALQLGGGRGLVLLQPGAAAAAVGLRLSVESMFDGCYHLASSCCSSARICCSLCISTTVVFSPEISQ